MDHLLIYGHSTRIIRNLVIIIVLYDSIISFIYKNNKRIMFVPLDTKIQTRKKIVIYISRYHFPLGGALW
jgi:hypothetical protein